MEVGHILKMEKMVSYAYPSLLLWAGDRSKYLNFRSHYTSLRGIIKQAVWKTDV